MGGALSPHYMTGKATSSRSFNRTNYFTFGQDDFTLDGFLKLYLRKCSRHLTQKKEIRGGNCIATNRENNTAILQGSALVVLQKKKI